MRPYLAAGVAVVGASLIAVNPVAPTIAADIQERAVQLTGSVVSEVGDVSTTAATAVAGSLDLNALSSLAAAAGTATNPITEWADVLQTALTNSQTLANEWLADPFPVLAQVVHNQLGFANTIGANFQEMDADLLKVITQELPGQLQTMVNGIQAGDISSSVGTFNGQLLRDLLPIATPFLNILKVPGEMATNFANAINDNLTTIGLTALLTPISLYSGTSQAPADGVQSVVDAGGAGQTSEAIVDALNIPAKVTGAFLNGYQSGFYPGTTGLLGTPGSMPTPRRGRRQTSCAAKFTPRFDCGLPAACPGLPRRRT